jgi:pyruvate/2-oxoglutarate dehydrogenase complex dihydrolipoamide acyltransferase (E2) component
MTDVELPKLADTLVEGTVARWLKQPGDAVRKGEPLVEIETDKINSELEAPADGVLAEVLVPEGETVPVGSVLARISGEAQARAETPAGVHEAVAGPRPEPGLSPMRRRIAERMQEARARVAQGACVREVDLTRIERGERSWTAYFVKALAAAAGVDDVGVAVEVPDGLLVPVVRGARSGTAGEVSALVADLAGRAREGKLRPDEIGGAEVTVTNLGGGGTLMAFPLVNPGERAILACGAIRDGRCYLTLAYDRRHYDDWAADRLLARVAEELGKL